MSAHDPKAVAKEWSLHCTSAYYHAAGQKVLASSYEGQVGLNVAAGVTTVTLTWVP
jgi:hypothetical protein